ncbi:MAG: hypothetical protein HYX69_12625 [Planctomycetia bacterium]|nr:hypothetical protein [Planctomycetia bacterium]
MLDRPAAEHRVRYVVEDDRDESGHLQRQRVAPVAGFFQPAAALGSAVQRGDAIGHIVGPLGDVLATVRAAAPGTLLFLRTFPSVAAGDPLAAILPIQAPGDISYRRGP